MHRFKWMMIVTLTLSVGALSACENPEAEPGESPAEATAPESEAAETAEGTAVGTDEAARQAAAAQGEQEGAAPEKPIVGEPAPDFTLVDEAGNSHTLSQYKGKTVVLEWFNIPCPYVNRHYDAGTFDSLLKEHGEANEIVWLAIDSTHDNTPEDSQAWKAKTDEKREFSYPILQDPSGEVGRLYQAKTTPHMFVIDSAGILRYMGGIDDDPRGNSEAPTNYVDAALTAMAAGEDIATTEAQPYGCTVKYAEGS